MGTELVDQPEPAVLSRNASSRSDNSFTRTGGQSFSGSSSASSAGSQ